MEFVAFSPGGALKQISSCESYELLHLKQITEHSPWQGAPRYILVFPSVNGCPPEAQLRVTAPPRLFCQHASRLDRPRPSYTQHRLFLRTHVTIFRRTWSQPDA